MYPLQQPAKQIKEACSASNYKNCIKVQATVKPGDQMWAEVKYLDKGLFQLAIQDFTQGWYTGGKGTTLPPLSQPGSDLTAARTHAEWIVEAPASLLTNFDTVQFSACRVDNMSISEGSTIIKYVAVSTNDPNKIKAQLLD